MDADVTRTHAALAGPVVFVNCFHCVAPSSSSAYSSSSSSFFTFLLIVIRTLITPLAARLYLILARRFLHFTSHAASASERARNN